MAPPNCFCGAIFGTHQHLKEHVEEKGHRFRCTCNSLFADLLPLLDHRIDSPVVHDDSCTHAELPALVLFEQSPGMDLSSPEQCSICGKRLANGDGVNAHKESKHPECPKCHEVFVHPNIRTARQYLCRHQKNSGHCYCDQNGLAFNDLRSYRDHERREAHVTGFECLSCDRQFGSQLALDHHLQVCNASAEKTALAGVETSACARAVFAAVEEANLHCEACKRDFPSVNALRQHKSSVKHNPLSNLEGFLSPSCRQIFTSPSAFILHLESGKCKSGMINRQKLNDLIHAEDANREITFASNANPDLGLASILGRLSVSKSVQSDVLITPGSDAETVISIEEGVALIPDDSDAVMTTVNSSEIVLTPNASNRSRSTSTGGVMLTPPATSTNRSERDFISNDAIMTPTTTSIDESFVGTLTYDNTRKRWRCNLCKKTFRKKTDVLLHLNSPAHAPALYHCPPPASLGRAYGKPQKSFKTLSGFAQYVEAGACTGGKEGAKVVVGMIESVVRAATGRSVRLLGDAF